MTKKSLYKRLGIGKEDNPEDMSSVNSLYQNNGYLFSKIDPGEEVVGEIRSISMSRYTKVNRPKSTKWTCPETGR